MSYREGTLVTQYMEIDERTGAGQRTCKGYDRQDLRKIDTTDICVGIVLDIPIRGIQVRWIKPCTTHESEHSPVGWYGPGELWEIGQLA